MLKKCRYTLKSLSIKGVELDFTPFVISMSLNWGLNASKASAKISLAQESKTFLKTIKRGSVFTLEWGWDKSAFNKVQLYWIGTSWEINANVVIELVHKSWELARTPIRGVFTGTNAAVVAGKLAIKRGIKIDTSLAKFQGVGAITVSQPSDLELIRQFKGQVIKHDYDGSSLKIIDFANLKDNAQVYYINTRAGYIGNMVINYKAVLPKDKSYIELLSGGITSAEPNNNPTKPQSANTSSIPALPSGKYALLLSTGNKNKLNNPILELKLIVNGEQIGSYPCVSGRAFTQDSSKTDNVLPDGEYTIDSKLVPGSIAEIGGKFLGITPKFKTSRSALGIHLDPSYNKNNGEDGTNGCIGLTTPEDRSAVHRLILENNIRTLIVNLKKSPEQSSNEPVTKTVNSAYYIGTLTDNRIIAKSNDSVPFNSVASLFKLFIADAVLKSNISLSEVYGNKTISQWLNAMMDASDNTAANTLINRLGGLNTLNAFCKKSGFNSSEIDSLYDSKNIGLKKSTAKDLFNGFKDLFIKSDSNYTVIQQFLVGRGLDIESETYTKIGFNSVFNGAVSLIEGSSGTKYIVAILAKTEKEKLFIAKSLKGYFI